MDTLSMGRPIGSWRERILNETTQSNFKFGAANIHGRLIQLECLQFSFFVFDADLGFIHLLFGSFFGPVIGSADAGCRCVLDPFQ